MLSFVLTRHSSTAPTFYRVAVEYNLFGEYSVMREWGAAGSPGQNLVVWFSNIRDACRAAEQWRSRAMRRGYVMEIMMENTVDMPLAKLPE